MPRKPKVPVRSTASNEVRARLVVHGADELTKREIQVIAKWMSRQVEVLIENDGKLAATYRATLY